MKNILVGIDFDKYTLPLINHAVEYAEAFKAKIWLLHVAAPEPDFVGYDVGPQYIRDARAEDLKEEHMQIGNYVNQLKQKGLEADGLLIQGTTSKMILEESQKLAIDLIITGHHEHNMFYSFLFGSSTSSSIIKQSKTPVLVVPLQDD